VREWRIAWNLLLVVVQSVLWVVETLWLGGKSIFRASVLIARYRQITAEVRLCPRGHEVAMYGLFDCHCGARLEGWAFSRCEVCHESAAWTPCLTCGLPVRNPLLV
jgi:hypothetical protein